MAYIFMFIKIYIFDVGSFHSWGVFYSLLARNYVICVLFNYNIIQKYIHSICLINYSYILMDSNIIIMLRGILVWKCFFIHSFIFFKFDLIYDKVTKVLIRYEIKRVWKMTDEISSDIFIKELENFIMNRWCVLPERHHSN